MCRPFGPPGYLGATFVFGMSRASNITRRRSRTSPPRHERTKIAAPGHFLSVGCRPRWSWCVVGSDVRLPLRGKPRCFASCPGTTVRHPPWRSMRNHEHHRPRDRRPSSSRSARGGQRDGKQQQTESAGSNRRPPQLPGGGVQLRSRTARSRALASWQALWPATSSACGTSAVRRNASKPGTAAGEEMACSAARTYEATHSCPGGADGLFAEPVGGDRGTRALHRARASGSARSNASRCRRSVRSVPPSAGAGSRDSRGSRRTACRRRPRPTAPPPAPLPGLFPPAPRGPQDHPQAATNPPRPPVAAGGAVASSPWTAPLRPRVGSRRRGGAEGRRAARHIAAIRSAPRASRTPLEPDTDAS